MPEFLSQDLILRLLILAIPLIAVLAVLVLRRSRREQPAPPISPAPVSHETPVAFAPPLAEEKVPAGPAGELAQLETQIREAEARGDKAAAAALSLEMAAELQLLGREKDALNRLRSAAGLSAKSGPALVHAQARLALAEAAFVTGDLTTACEQWQLARTAYQKDGATAKAGEVDDRMRANGCPTDWVLTDF